MRAKPLATTLVAGLRACGGVRVFGAAAHTPLTGSQVWVAGVRPVAGAAVLASPERVTHPLSLRVGGQPHTRVWGGPKAHALRVFLRLVSGALGAGASLAVDANPTAGLSWAEAVRLELLKYRTHRLLSEAAQARSSVASWVTAAELFVVVLRQLDPTWLLGWVRARMQSMGLFGHRRFLQTLFVFFEMAMADAEAANPGTRYGVYVRVAGKVAVVGNARKRSVVLRAGPSSTSAAGVVAEEAFGLIRTATGCLGVEVALFAQARAGRGGPTMAATGVECSSQP